MKLLKFLLVIFGFYSVELMAIDLIRIGTAYGGWTIPKDLLHKESICYCAGAGEDISFDIGLVNEYGCNVYIFDPTPRAKKHFDYIATQVQNGKKAKINNGNKYYTISEKQLDKLFFHPFGLWHEESVQKFYVPKNSCHVSHSILNLQKTDQFFEAVCKRLSTIMDQLGHNHLDLLKLDIEGAEYAVLDSILEDNVSIRCICLEFDELAGVNLQCNNRVAQSIAKIKAYIQKLENYGFKMIYQNGFTDMTFLKR